MGDVSVNEILQCFTGYQSTAGTPFSHGTPMETSAEVMIGELGFCKVGDLATIPSAADEGPIQTGHESVLVCGAKAARLGDAVMGKHGTPATIGPPATQPSVVTGDSGKVTVAQFVPSGGSEGLDFVRDVLMQASEAIPGVGSGMKVVNNFAAADSVAGADTLRDAVKAGGGIAGAAASKTACLSVALSAGVSTAPLVSTGAGSVVPAAAIVATWATCTVGASKAGEVVAGVVYDAVDYVGDAIEENAKATTRRQYQDAMGRFASGQLKQSANFGGFMGY